MTRRRNNPEHVLTNAERCKRYRQKTIGAYCKEDAMNKRYKRMIVSKDHVTNEKRLKEQAEKKRIYRLRKKLEGQSIPANLDQNQCETSTPS